MANVFAQHQREEKSQSLQKSCVTISEACKGECRTSHSHIYLKENLAGIDYSYENRYNKSSIAMVCYLSNNFK